MHTHRSAALAIATTFFLAVALGGTVVAGAGCERSHSVGGTSPAATTAASKGQAPASAGTGGALDGGVGAGDVAGYVQLEGLYRELAGTGATTKEPWASLARQMGHMRHLAESRGPTGSPGMMGPSQMGGRRMDGQGMMGTQDGGMTGRGMMWQRTCGLDEWNRQMATMSREDAEAARAAGDAERARTLDEVAKEHTKLADRIGAGPSAPLGTQGSEIFAATCAPCHQAQGDGVPGVFPPLRGDPVVLGPDERLIQVVLGGLNRPLEIGGRQYYGVMPSFAARLDDATVAAVLSYIRTAWGNNAPPVTPERVAGARR